MGIQIETPQPGDRAAFAPTLRNLYDSAAADRGVTSEFVLARVVEAPYPDWSLMWVASVNVGGRPHVNSSGQMIGITDQYTLVFFEPDSGNAVFQKDIFIPGS